MAVGRKPKPTKIRAIAGNPGHRPLNDNEPQPEIADVDPPARLTGEALQEWQRIAPILRDAGLLTVVDRNGLAMYCEAFDLYADAMDKVRATGTVVKSQKGLPIQSPFLQIANKQWEKMHKMLVEFGMTPSSRSRVQVNPTNGGAKSGWEDF